MASAPDQTRVLWSQWVKAEHGIKGGLLAPLVRDGPVNNAEFVAWVEKFLALQLRPGDMVVMDDLSSHKVTGVKPAIEAAGAALRYLPPYSPDFNPIEQVFAKPKGLLRSTQARTPDALWSAIGALLDRFAPDECEHHIRHCSYCRSGRFRSRDAQLR